MAGKRTRCDLDGNLMLRMALNHCLEILGEAASRRRLRPGSSYHRSRSLRLLRCATGSFTRTSMWTWIASGRLLSRTYPHFCLRWMRHSPNASDRDSRLCREDAQLEGVVATREEAIREALVLWEERGRDRAEFLLTLE